MAEEEKTSKKAEKVSKKDAKKSDKKKSNKKNPFKSIQKFFKGVNAERKKVVWPTGKDVLKNTIVVLVVASIAGVAIYAMDTGLSLGMKGIKKLADKTSASQQAENQNSDTELVENNAE